MIIECPACATRYEVPDAAIGTEGRKVRCAKCRHSWHATSVEVDDFDDGAGLDEAPDDALEPLAAEKGSAVEPAAPEGDEIPGPAIIPEAVEASEAGLTVDPVPSYEAETAPIPGQSKRYWLWALAILALMIVTVAGAVLLWGPPAWLGGRGDDFALEAPDELVLDFPRDQQGPRQLSNGTEIFGASGTITNSGDTTRRVPPILIVLRDSHERIVYSWEVAPPKARLAPGETVAVNEAVTDAPRSAEFADIFWKTG